VCSKKIFVSAYPRSLVNHFWFWRFPAFDALPVALTLTIPLLLARRRFPVTLLGLPPRPPSPCLPALIAAIPLTCMPGMKTLLAAFE
jgi:hypothetical protein